MDTMMQTMLAVLAANMLTVAFVYGVVSLTRVYRDEDAKAGPLLCVIIPALVTSAGFYLFS